MVTRSAQEKQWAAEEDAYTVARAKEVQNDPKRMAAAKAAAAKMLKEQEGKTKALKQVVGRTPAQKSSPKANKTTRKK